MLWFRRERDEPDPEPEPDPSLLCQDTDDLVKLYARGQAEALGDIWRRHYRFGTFGVRPGTFGPSGSGLGPGKGSSPGKGSRALNKGS